MRNCIHNETIGLHNRYLKASSNEVTYDSNIVEGIIDELAAKMKPNYSGPMSLGEFMAGKKGKLGMRYKNAVLDVKKNGFDPIKHSKITAFVKNEIYAEKKPPRMIMGRDPRYNLIYGLFTTALEHAMTQIPEFSKGKNFVERGKQFAKLLFGQWYLEGDFSKYEGTQREELLTMIELGLARRLMNDADYILFEKLFYVKMIKDGHTLNGLKFRFNWCRGSGDMDTGLGNSLICWVACKYFCIINKIPHRFIVDGDDNTIGIPKGMNTYTETFKLFGLDAKLIIKKDYHDVDYCSGKFIQYKAGEFLYVQNVRKIMQNIRFFRKKTFAHARGDYYYSLGLMYKILYSNFPLYQNIANALMRIGGTRKNFKIEVLDSLNKHYRDHMKGMDAISVDESHISNIKLEIAMCFGMSVGEINYYSKFYDSLNLSLPKEQNKILRSAKDNIKHEMSDFTTTYKVVEQTLRGTMSNLVIRHDLCGDGILKLLRKSKST